MNMDAHVLVVEDSPTQAAELQFLLESNGCKVTLARNGQEALRALEQFRPTLVLSDIVMPEMDGYTLCRNIKQKKQWADIPVILVTALADPRDVIRGLTSGADNFIVKPFSEKYLLSRIQYFLINHELRSHERMQLGFEVLLDGERHFITSSRQQILDLLISTYEQGIRLNTELREKHDELARSNSLLHNLYAFASQMTSTQTIDEVVEQALGALIKFNGIESLWIVLQDADSQKNFKEVGRLGKADFPKKYAAEVPLVLDGEPLGFLYIGQRNQQLWSNDMLEAFTAIGRQLALSLGRARLFEGLEDLIEKRTSALVASEHAMRMRTRAVEASSNAIIITENSADQPTIYVNPAFERITGYSAKEIIGRNCKMLQGDDTDQGDLDRIRRAITNGEQGTAVLLNYRKDGSPFWNELTIAPVEDDYGKVTHFVGEVRDITEFKRYQEELERQANFDSLTGLPNRNLFADRLQQSIAHAVEDNEQFAVAYFDIDNFKVINDSLGHEVGDTLLKQIAQRLTARLDATDTAARVAGDDFMLILTNGSLAEYIRQIEEIRRELAAPIKLDGNNIEVTFSVGVCMFPEDGDSVSVLQRNADTAMYQAKRLGRNQLCLFKPEMNQVVQRRLKLEQAMRHGLRNNEFLVYYQPQQCLHKACLSGLEALVRWQHDGKIVPPDEFISMAEQNGLIFDLDLFVLNEACSRVAQLRKVSPEATMAVNVSSLTFMHDNFIDRFEQTLKANKVSANNIKIEVTESILIGNSDEALKRMTALKASGVTFAIDDFGTGYSSLAYLKRFPFSQLKIDRAFINDVHEDADSAALVRSMISMGHNLGIQVIAEGVESEAHIEFLKSVKCDEIQGYFLSKPLPYDELSPQFEKWHKAV